MKIIDNKKDYYDYLAGIYGVDDLVVYDRRGSVVLESEKALFQGMEVYFRDCRLILLSTVVKRAVMVYCRTIRPISTAFTSLTVLCTCDFADYFDRRFGVLF